MSRRREYLVNEPSGGFYLPSFRPLTVKENIVLAALTDEFLDIPMIAKRAKLHSSDCCYTNNCGLFCSMLVRKGFAEYIVIPGKCNPHVGTRRYYRRKRG